MAGKLQMDWSSANALRVRDHRFWRDSRGNMVVLVRFENPRESRFIARIRVKFADERGVLEEGATVTSIQHFRPGQTTMSWTSSRAEAESYVIEVRSARFFQW
jgi:hypothetical protein